MSVIEENELVSLGAEVAVGEIDAALHRFFSGGGGAGDNPAGIARASLLNLAVYSEELESVPGLSGVIEELTRETACRAILILAQAGGTPSVRSWVQAHCRLSEQGEKTVCTEQVSFLLSGADASLVRNTVFAHLDSDLPLVFWWRGELSDVFEERLYSRIDRFIFDSAKWAQPGIQLFRVCEALRESDQAFLIHDLAYTRCHPMRLGLARVFDDPATSGAVDDIQGFEIVHVPGQRMTALWLAAWIGHRLDSLLDTQASSADRFVFRSEKLNRRLEIVCREDKDAGGGEAIREMRVQLGARGNFNICHDPQSGFWRTGWEVADCSTSQKLIPGHSRKDADLVAEVLVRAGRNRAMTESIPLLRELIVI